MSFPFGNPWLLCLMVAAMGAMTGSFLTVVLFAVRTTLRQRSSGYHAEARDDAVSPHPVSSAHNAPRLPVT